MKTNSQKTRNINRREVRHAERMAKRVNLEGESWLPVVGYEGAYEVSDMGRVYSVSFGRIMFQSTKKVTEQYSCKTVKLQFLGEIKGVGVHRLVALAHIPNPDNMPEVDHIDNDPLNNKKSNLQWGTHGDNIKWSYERGRDRRIGELSNSAKLTNTQVSELREKYRNGARFTELRNIYNISESSLSQIIKNRTYKTA